MVSLAKKRIKNVFTATLKNVSNGKIANVENEMLKAGYSKSSARCLKITKTKTWAKLLAEIDDEEILNKVKSIMRDEDKRSSLTAADMLFKLKDRYPAGKIKLGAFEERDKVIE